MNSKIRVRYAPSPTGKLHIGNARTAIFVYLFAKKNNGKMIFRTENTDKNRNIIDGEKSQMDNLKWLGVEWDEDPIKGGEYGPYRQLERLHIYDKYTKYLLNSGLAYKCYCTPEELEKKRNLSIEKKIPFKYDRKCLKKEKNDNINNKKYSIRLKIQDNEKIIWNDIVRGDISFNSEDIEDFIIVKSNGIPTYNYCCVIDDHLMKISHVLRGEEHISNTPKQILIYNAFKWDIPEFGHLSIIVNEQKKKLSKRDKNTVQFIEQFKEKGYLPEALFNFITLLGFSPEGNEIISRETFCEEFDVKRLTSSPAYFDVDKLNWMNSQYIKKLNDEEIFNLVRGYIPNIENYNKKWLIQLILLYKNQLMFGEEIYFLIKKILDNNFLINTQAEEYIYNNKDSINIMKSFRDKINKEKEITKDIIKKIIKEISKEANVKNKKLYMPLRIITTGDVQGPSLIDIIVLLKNKIKKIIDTNFSYINKNKLEDKEIN